MTAAWMLRSGSGGSTGQSVPKARRAPAVEQRPPGVGRPGAVAPAPIGDPHIRSRMKRLHRGDDVESGEARDVVRVDELGVLDAEDLRRGLRVRVGAGDLGGVEHQPHGRVADGVGGDAETGRAGLPDQVDEFAVLDGRRCRGRRAAVVVRLEHRGRPRAEGAVGEQLEQPDPQPVAAEAGAAGRPRRRGRGPPA